MMSCSIKIKEEKNQTNKLKKGKHYTPKNTFLLTLKMPYKKQPDTRRVTTVLDSLKK